MIRVTSFKGHNLLFCLDSLFVRMVCGSIGKERFAHRTADSIVLCGNNRNTKHYRPISALAKSRYPCDIVLTLKSIQSGSSAAGLGLLRIL